MDEKYRFKGNTLPAAVFALWFIASLIGFVVMGVSGNYPAMLIIFGQLFLIFGLFFLIGGLTENKFYWICVPSMLVGAAVLTAGLIQRYGSSEVKEKMMAAVPIVGLAVFPVAGIAMFTAVFTRYKRLTEICTEPVTAACTRLLLRGSRRKILRCPVYEIEYGGETAELCDNIYSSMRNPSEGETRDLLICPEDPQFFLDLPRRKAELKLTSFIAAAFVVFPTIGLAVYLL